MNWIIRSVSIFVICMGAIIVGAQDDAHPEIEFIPSGPNNPWVNEIANACYYGGTLSGKCNTTDVNGDKVVDQYDRDWMWNAGWHLIRREYNIAGFGLNNFDDAYAPILPETSRRSINQMAVGCYEITMTDNTSRWIKWPGGASVQTVEMYFNDQCRYTFTLMENVIAIEDIGEADAICKRDRGKHLYADRFANSFYQCVYYRPNFSTYPPATTDNQP